MVKRYFVIFLSLITFISVHSQVREVMFNKGSFYSQATLMVDTIYNISYEKDSVMVIVPRGEGIVYPNNETMGQFVTWMQGHPVYATPIVQYDSVAHRRNISGDTLRIIFSNSTKSLPQYTKQPVVWQHRQVTITDSAQLLSAEQYKAIAQGGDTSLFILEPTIIYTDTLRIRNIVDTVYDDSQGKNYRYGFTQEHWDAATSVWGHQGRGHAPMNQSCIQGTMVYGVRLKIAKTGSLNVYKIPSLLEKNEDNFEFVATLMTDSIGVQDFDFPQPIYVAPNEYLVFGKPSDAKPTLCPCYVSKLSSSFPIASQGFAHYVGEEKVSASSSPILMVEFY